MAFNRGSICYILLFIALVVPWGIYVTSIFKWPWPSDEGCYVYNCSYGINIVTSNNRTPDFMYSTMVNNSFLGPRCDVQMSCNPVNGYFNGSMNDWVGMLNWFLRYCVPTNDNGQRLYNNTACYSGDGSDIVDHPEGGVVYCPFRSTCYNFARDSNRSLFLSIAPVFILTAQLLLCGLMVLITRRIDESNQYSPI